MNLIVSKVSRLGRLQMNLPPPCLPNLTMTMSLSLLYILFYTLSWNLFHLSILFSNEKMWQQEKFCFLGPPDPGFHQSPQREQLSSLDWDDYDEMLAAQEKCDAKPSACPFIDYEAIEASGSDSEDNENIVTVKSKRARSKRLVSYSDSDNTNDV